MDNAALLKRLRGIDTALAADLIGPNPACIGIARGALIALMDDVRAEAAPAPIPATLGPHRTPLTDREFVAAHAALLGEADDDNF